MRYICRTPCYHYRRLWSRGEVFEPRAPDEPVPHHFVQESPDAVTPVTGPAPALTLSGLTPPAVPAGAATLSEMAGVRPAGRAKANAAK